MVKRLCCSGWLVFSSCLLLAALVSSKHHGNPANDLVEIINNNRTSHKLSKLNDSPGLGCMALQFAKSCKGNCSRNGTINCTPSEDDFTEVFAPNCGVELPTFGTITGHIVGCHSKYLEPSLAFVNVLVGNNKALSILRNKSHNEVGVGMVGVHKGPFFWTVLFSSGKTNSTFVLENRGAGIQQKKGCYSGSSIPCSAGQNIKADSVIFNNVMIIGFLCAHLLQKLYFNLL
ncbi:putative CAP domain-containing protein [Rosa chinensis]|uniref:Putative CAP domain-containing protein n=1 Tax=Rosa chinensis TaxID=74649 RepID=A0A2P6SEG7_ROSCH|nr:uncharacterized protein LOC112173985 [Rosa chinensis]PRQ57072.1 putative CAP domain-containing protein [Rosa chinensis]